MSRKAESLKRQNPGSVLSLVLMFADVCCVIKLRSLASASELLLALSSDAASPSEGDVAAPSGISLLIFILLTGGGGSGRW